MAPNIDLYGTSPVSGNHSEFSPLRRGNMEDYETESLFPHEKTACFSEFVRSSQYMTYCSTN